MAMAVAQHHRESSSGSSIREQQQQHMDAGKYVRYTAEQVEALERVYAECPKPSSLRRQQLIRECPILANIEPKQIKVWFQNRRCREKQRKESSRLQTVNRKLSAMNKLLMEENDRLQKQVSQLVCENGYMKQQLQTTAAPNADGSSESAVTTTQHSLRDVNNPAGLLSIAEETLAEFLSKATGTAVDWVQMPGMKPGPDSVGIFAISHSCSGVAARACGLVSLEPTKIAEILKDRPSWFRDCRSLEVFTIFPAGNGGTIELIYTQVYAPTTLAPARDFWTLRYTTTLENGSLVVCERSLSGSGPNTAASPQFIRAVMLPSGYLIRPCEGGGSIIHIVDHINLEAWSVPEVLRPLYQSSKVVAQKMTIAALRYVRQIAQETSGEVVYGLGRQPVVLRTFSQRLSRGFNDAINGFTNDGWSMLCCNGPEDVVVTINSTKNIMATSNPAYTLSMIGGILCAKASMLLQNVPPAVLVRFLREHRSEWADFNVDAYAAAALKASAHAFPGMRPTRFTGRQIIMPLGHTIEHEELLEVVRLEGHSLTPEDDFISRDIHLLQICSGIDENAVGACSELVFAPIDEMFPDDAPLLPSGFRIIPLDAKPEPVTQRTLDLTSSLDVGPSTNAGAADALSSCNSRSVLTIAFQFPYESSLQDNVANMARQYVRSVIASVQRVALAISPSGLTPAVAQKMSPGSPEAITLAHWICQSYSYYLGAELLRTASAGDDAVLKHLWHHPDAILCCSLKSLPFLIFANQAGLDMLETTLVALQDVTLDKIFDDSGRKALFSDFPNIMQQGFSCLPAGICMSTMGRHVSYEQDTLLAMKRRDMSCDQVILTTMIHMYSKAGSFQRAEAVVNQLKLLGQPLDRMSYDSMIMVHIRSGMPEKGEDLMREMEELEMRAGREIYKALLRAYSMSGDSAGAQRVFDSIQIAGIHPDVRLCGLLINAYVVAGQSGEARIAFENMRKAGIEPNDKCVALLLAAFEKENQLNSALNLLLSLERDGITMGKEASDLLAQWFRRLGVVEDVALVLRGCTEGN